MDIQFWTLKSYIKPGYSVTILPPYVYCQCGKKYKRVAWIAKHYRNKHE